MMVVHAWGFQLPSFGCFGEVNVVAEQGCLFSTSWRLEEVVFLACP